MLRERGLICIAATQKYNKIIVNVNHEKCFVLFLKMKRKTVGVRRSGLIVVYPKIYFQASLKASEPTSALRVLHCRTPVSHVCACLEM